MNWTTRTTGFYLPSSSFSLRCGLPSFLLNVSTCPGPGKGIGGSDAIRTNVFREHVSHFPESACNPQPKSRGASAKLEGTTIWRTTPARLVVIRVRVASGKSMLRPMAEMAAPKRNA